MVGLQVGFLWHEIGDGAFAHAFFSTVSYRLEDGKWGSRFPYLMRRLFYQQLDWKEIKFARKELKIIQKELKKFPPDQVVWDIEDLSKRPPWGDKISSDIKNLSNYFVTSDGKDLIGVFFQAFKEAEKLKETIEIAKL